MRLLSLLEYSALIAGTPSLTVPPVLEVMKKCFERLREDCKKSGIFNLLGDEVSALWKRPSGTPPRGRKTDAVF